MDILQKKVENSDMTEVDFYQEMGTGASAADLYEEKQRKEVMIDEAT